MPIGRPINLTANVARKDITATATAGQTQFTVTGGYRVNQIGVYRNGVRLVNGTDFTATDGSTVVFTSGATLNDKMVFQIYDDFDLANIAAAPGDFTVGGDLGVSGLSTVANVYSTGIVTAGINTGFSDLFPVSVGDNVLVENISVGVGSTSKGYKYSEI